VEAYKGNKVSEAFQLSFGCVNAAMHDIACWESRRRDILSIGMW
jgi:hypothetical protein